MIDVPMAWLPTLDPTTWLAWIIPSTMIGGLLVLVAKCTQYFIGQRVPACWLYWIWIAITLRFVFLALPASPFSIENTWQTTAQPASVSIKEEPPSSSLKKIDSTWQSNQTTTTHHTPLYQPQSLHAFVEADTSTESWLSNINGWMILTCVWLLGIGVMAVTFLKHLAVIRRTIAQSDPNPASRIRLLLQQAKVKTKTRRTVDLRIGEHWQTPSLIEWPSPVILLPRWCVDELDDEEISLILVHELVHLRRHDGLIQLATHAITMLHWFNPMVHVAIRQVARNRELSCDQQVLSTLSSDSDSIRRYGSTLLKVIARCQSTQSTVPIWTPSFLGNRPLVHERIHMLVNHSKTPRLSIAFGFILMTLLLSVGFTSAQSNKPTESPTTVSKDANTAIENALNPLTGLRLPLATSFAEAPQPPAIGDSLNCSFFVWQASRAEIQEVLKYGRLDSMIGELNKPNSQIQVKQISEMFTQRIIRAAGKLPSNEVNPRVKVGGGMPSPQVYVGFTARIKQQVSLTFSPDWSISDYEKVKTSPHYRFLITPTLKRDTLALELTAQAQQERNLPNQEIAQQGLQRMNTGFEFADVAGSILLCQSTPGAAETTWLALIRPGHISRQADRPPAVPKSGAKPAPQSTTPKLASIEYELDYYLTTAERSTEIREELAIAGFLDESTLDRYQPNIALGPKSGPMQTQFKKLLNVDSVEHHRLAKLSTREKESTGIEQGDWVARPPSITGIAEDGQLAMIEGPKVFVGLNIELTPRLRASDGNIINSISIETSRLSSDGVVVGIHGRTQIPMPSFRKTELSTTGISGQSGESIAVFFDANLDATKGETSKEQNKRKGILVVTPRVIR